ncbi:MAG: class II glutamine amidotransferase [Acetobacteraceae bacterium]
MRAEDGLCELFAMSSGAPGRVSFAFAEFVRHGAPHGANPDGWGAAYYEGADAHLVREAVPATRSDFVPILEHHRIPSQVVLAHVRHATRGPATLANTHPFARALGGRRHTFAHNGSLPGIEAALPLDSATFRPIGETDSEYAFLVLLERLRPLWAQSGTIPDAAQRLEILAAFAARLRDLGTANFLYSDGDLLFAHAHRRRYPDAIRPPGLHIHLRNGEPRHRLAAEGIAVETTGTEAHSLALIASVPLTAKGWRPLGEGRVIALAGGRIIGEA